MFFIDKVEVLKNIVLFVVFYTFTQSTKLLILAKPMPIITLTPKKFLTMSKYVYVIYREY